MESLDIVISILLLLIAVRGFIKGFVRELSSLVALVAGIYAAFFFSDIMAEFIQTMFNLHSKYLHLIAFAVTLILIMVLIAFVGKMLHKVVESLSLGLLNRIAGAVFGILKGILLLSLLIMLLNYFQLTNDLISGEKQNQSRFYHKIESFAPMLFNRIHFENPSNNNKTGKNSFAA